MKIGNCIWNYGRSSKLLNKDTTLRFQIETTHSDAPNAGCTQRSLAALSGVLMADSGYFSAIVSDVVFQLSQ